MAVTSFDEFDWSILGEENAKKRYICGFEGCTRSYSSRQNRYRHRINDHSQDLKSSHGSNAPPKKENQKLLQRERELLIETYSSLYEQIGEAAAAAALKNNKMMKDHLLPLRRFLETDIAERLSNAQESGSIVEKQLSDLEKSFPTNLSDELVAFKEVISCFKKVTPESIGYLKQFAKAMSAFIVHAEKYSEINPKIRQAQALKKVLDELFIEVRDELLPSVAPVKRKQDEISQSAPVSSVSVDGNKLKHAKGKPEVDFLDAIFNYESDDFENGTIVTLDDFSDKNC